MTAGTDHDNHIVATLTRGNSTPRSIADLFGIGDAGAAKLLNKYGHGR
jgi:hypothetical protein